MPEFGLKHIHVEGVITGLDFQDGLLELDGPDSQYLNNILAFCKKGFTEFKVSCSDKGTLTSLPIKDMTQIFTADVDVKEKCSIHFAEPVHAVFEFIEKANVLSVTFTFNSIKGISGSGNSNKVGEWIDKLKPKAEEKSGTEKSLL